MLIIAILLFGMITGFLASLIVSGRGGRPDWGRNLVAGLVGSFVGGAIGALVAGDGLELRPSGWIGSIIGAVVVLLVWKAVDNRRTA